MTESASTTIEPGIVLAGKYRVESKLGEGGMGAVWKALQTDLDRAVAIKVLLADYKDDVQFVERFFREAKAAARVKGTHVVSIIDVGKLDSGEPFMAMELLDGEDLSKVLEREGKVDVALAATYMLHACAAVAEAHAARVVHRDLKPANLFLAKQASGKTVLKVLDFGISRVEDAASKLTKTQTALGTAFYMSPEQIMSPKTIDFRVDIWALGVIFYELLTGKTPFEGETLPSVIAHVLQNTRVPLHDVDPTIPPKVEQIVDRCLQMSPGDRFQSAVELASALNALTGTAADGEEVMQHLLSLPPPGTGRGTQPSMSDISVPSAPKLPTALDANTDVVAKTAVVDGVPELELRATAASAPRVAAAPPASARDLQGAAPQLDLAPTDGAFDGSLLELDRKPTANRHVAPHVRDLADRERTRARPRASSGGGGSFKRLLGFFIGVVLVVGLPLGVFVILPNVVNKRIDEAAAKAGFTLVHEPASFSSAGVTITGVVAKVMSLPGTSFKASSIDVTWAGDSIVVRGVIFTSKDSPAALQNALHATDGALAPAIEVVDITADYSVAEDVSLKGTGGKLTLAGSGTNRKTTVAFQEARLVTKSGAVGPYRIDAENGPSVSRMRIGLDPAAPDGANVLLAWSGGALHLGAKVPRASLAGYGVPPVLVGLREGDNPDVELDVDTEVDARSVVSGKGKLALYKAKLGPSQLDVSAEFSIDGTADVVDVRSGKARIGPFPATMSAQWKRSEKDNVSITFQTVPVPCADIANAKARSTPIGALLTDLVAYTGAVTFGGKAQVKGSVTVVLETPPRISGKIAESDTCGLLIFPRKL